MSGDAETDTGEPLGLSATPCVRWCLCQTLHFVSLCYISGFTRATRGDAAFWGKPQSEAHPAARSLPCPCPPCWQTKGWAARQGWAEVTRLCTLSLLCGCPVAVLAARHGIGLQKASTPCYLDPQIILSFNLFLLFPLTIQPLLQQLPPALLCILPTSLPHSFHLLPSPIFS